MVPILFIVFSRPDTTRIVFNRIREMAPSRLYVASDAPREGREDEKKRCGEVKEIVSRVDWDCEVKYLSREKNLGCQRAVAEAITWFFGQEEYGVILEDDCVPDPSFFPFCEELLLRYKDDSRVGHISGDCFLPGVVRDGLSYDFCSVAHITGWATWRRVWQNVDIGFPFWNKEKERRPDLFCNKWEEIYFSSFISDTLAYPERIECWDVFYYFSLRLQHQLSVYPAVNLVTHIGWDANATHTKKLNNKLYIPYQTMKFPLKHPEYIMANKALNHKAVLNHFFSYKRLARFWLHLY